MKSLIKIQSELKAPKGQTNKFGGYKYRSCEDILESVKPLLAKNGCTLIVQDDIVPVEGRIYVKATATLNDGENTVTATAFAREAETKKGMDEAQITGSASSYARKYCLSGLFCLDDSADPDATNDHGKSEAKGEHGLPTQVGTKPSSTLAQQKKVVMLARMLKREDKLSHDMSTFTGRKISDAKLLTRDEAKEMIDRMSKAVAAQQTVEKAVSK